MRAKKQPRELKRLVQHLRDLPEHTPPAGLHQQIMSALPARRGLFGRLEYAFKRSMSLNYCTGSTRLMPSSPFEYGAATVITGFFLLLLAFIFVVTVYRTGLDDTFSYALFALSPALLGSLFLVVAGWVQIKSPHCIIRQHIRFAAVCFLFGISAVLGCFAGGQYVINMTAGLLGLSGLLITLGLALTPMLSLTPRKAYYVQQSCVV